VPLPPRVDAAYLSARQAGFTLSCEPGVGWLLAALSASVPGGGRVLELGTGAGVGLAFIVDGLHGRLDVEVVTVDIEESMHALTRQRPWPATVHFELGDGAELVGALGTFDLIFADAPGGKLFGLDRTIDALRPGGVLLVDDMDLDKHEDPELREALAGVRRHLFDHEDLACAELGYSSGVIVATRRRVERS
jgi:demethylmenaquinone methyltransferase/2-methoxy-6-polyprenyl-1,4-benzoquinol methylase